MESKPQPACPLKNRNLVLKRSLLIFLVGVCFLVFFGLGLDHYLTFQGLKQNKEFLTEWRDKYYLISVLSFIITYSILVSISVPVGVWMTLVSGFMFGTLPGGLFSLAGATTGATLIFCFARYTLPEVLKLKCGTAIIQMEPRFKENQLNYMLVLRLVPLFPFWLVNLVPAFLNVSLKTYVMGTLIGMIPGALIYASVGSGLGKVFEREIEPDIKIIFSPNIIIPLIGLAFLVLVPVIYKKKKVQD